MSTFPVSAPVLVAAGIATAAYAIPVAWTYKLQHNDCACSAGVKRDIIRYGFMAAIALILMRFFVTLPDERLWLLVRLFVFVLFCVTLSYIDDLRKLKCKCSKDWQRNFLVWWIGLSVGLTIISEVMAVVWPVSLPGPSGPMGPPPRIDEAASNLAIAKKIKKAKKGKARK